MISIRLKLYGGRIQADDTSMHGVQSWYLIRSRFSITVKTHVAVLDLQSKINVILLVFV